MKQLLTLLLLLLLAAPGTLRAQAPLAWGWATAPVRVGSGDCVIYSSTTDLFGATYATGYYTGGVRFGTTTLTNQSNFARPFVAKLNAAGQWQWAVEATPTGFGSCTGQAIALDAVRQRLYVAGDITGNMQFGSYTLGNISSNAFVAQLNPTTGAWTGVTAVSSASAGSLYSHRLSVSRAGRVVLATYFSGRLQVGGTSLQATGSGDLLVALFDPTTRSWLWAAQGSTPYGSRPATLTTDLAGDVYVGGSFGTRLTLGATTLTAAGGDDLFVARLAASTGAWLWGTRGSGPSNDFSNGLLATPTGELYLTGSYLYGPLTLGSTVLPGAGGFDTFAARLDPATGAWLWAAPVGSSGDEYLSPPILDDFGNLVMTGWLQGGSTFTSVDGRTASLTGVGSYSLFLARLSPSGQWHSLQAHTATGADGKVLSNDAAGNFYVRGGLSQNNVAFGPSTVGLNGFVLSSWYVAQLPGASLTATRAATAPGLRLFPVPAHHSLSVQLPTGLAPAAAVLLLDATGRVVRRQPWPTRLAPLSIDLRGLPAGLYWLQCGAMSARVLVE